MKPTDQQIKEFCEDCADGFISTHEKATNEVRAQGAKEERERIIKWGDEPCLNPEHDIDGVRARTAELVGYPIVKKIVCLSCSQELKDSKETQEPKLLDKETLEGG